QWLHTARSASKSAAAWNWCAPHAGHSTSEGSMSFIVCSNQPTPISGAFRSGHQSHQEQQRPANVLAGALDAGGQFLIDRMFAQVVERQSGPHRRHDVLTQL